jgi:predicted deacylase
VVAKADALIDIHSGTSESYVWYTIYESEVEGAKPDVIEKSKQMAIAFGLKDVMAESPWKGTFIEDAMRDGIPAITPEIGGGLDFFHRGKEQIETCARGITNVMKLLGMIDGEIVTEADEVTIWAGETEIINDAVGGIMLVERNYGDYLKKGDVYARMYNPFTGDEMKRIVAPADGYVIPSGARWPVIPPGRWLAILGSKLGVEKVSF